MTSSSLRTDFSATCRDDEGAILQQEANPKPKRLAPLSVRLSEDERATLERLARGRSLNACVKSRIFDGVSDLKPSQQRRSPAKRDQAIACALRILGQSGLVDYVQQRLDAIEAGRIPAKPSELAQLQAACLALDNIRKDLIRALGLRDGAGA